MNEKEIVRVAEKVLKGRRYVDDPEDAPEDAEVQEGDRGGYYYETNDGGDEEGEELNEDVDIDDISYGDELNVTYEGEDVRGEATYVEDWNGLVTLETESGEDITVEEDDINGRYEGSSEAESEDESDDGEGETTPDGDDEETDEQNESTSSGGAEVQDYDSTDERDEIGNTPGVLTEDWDSVETGEDLEDALENPESPFSRAEINGLSERQAKNWADAFEKIDKIGMFGEVDTVTTEGSPDGNEVGYWDESRSEMYLDAEQVYDEREAMSFYEGHTSSPHPASTAVHEAGHAMHNERASSSHERRKMSLSPDESVADEVSERAKASRGEFVAEVFAGIVAGGEDGEPRDFSEGVMELYDEYNGPPIPEEYL